MTEAVALNFESASAADIQRVSSSRSTKYTPLIVACLALKPGGAVKVPVPKGTPADKMRINISNAVRTRVSASWKASGKDQHVRIVRAQDENGEYVAVVCNTGLPAPRKPRTLKPKAAKKGK